VEVDEDVVVLVVDARLVLVVVEVVTIVVVVSGTVSARATQVPATT
jgi:hypothetical protein